LPLGSDDCLSDGILVFTQKWGDVIEPFGGGSQPNFADIASIVDKFRNRPQGPTVPRSDLAGVSADGVPNTPDRKADFTDIQLDVEAFRGFPFPFAMPPMCP